MLNDIRIYVHTNNFEKGNRSVLNVSNYQVMRLLICMLDVERCYFHLGLRNGEI